MAFVTFQANHLTGCLIKAGQECQSQFAVEGKFVKTALMKVSQLVGMFQQKFASCSYLFKNKTDVERTQSPIFSKAVDNSEKVEEVFLGTGSDGVLERL